MMQRESDTEVQVENQTESPVAGAQSESPVADARSESRSGTSETDTQAEPEGVQVSVGMKVGYMYSFLMQHTHRSFKGIFGVCISVAALVAFALSFDGSGDTTRRVILLIIGLLFTVVNPIILLIKAQQQVLLSPVYKNPLTYRFTEDAMTVSQGEQEQSLAWNAILEVRKTASVLIIYTAKNSASILAYQEMGENRQAVEEMIARGCKKAGITKIPASMEKDA